MVREFDGGDEMTKKSKRSKKVRLGRTMVAITGQPENKAVGAEHGPLLHSDFMRFGGPQALQDR
jgi:hypothetical protein